jgi:hypothetical protein
MSQYHDFKAPDQQTLADCSAFFMECKNYAKTPDDLPSDECLAECGAADGDAKVFFRRIYFFLRNRIMFRTKEGLPGMGPLFAQQGDMVCIIYGCPNVLVMRKERDFWRLLGDAFVHGTEDVSRVLF